MDMTMTTNIDNTQYCGYVGWVADSITNLVDDEDCSVLQNVVCDMQPTVAPTVMPTEDPTMTPSAEPTRAVSCGDEREGTTSEEYEYYFNINNNSIVLFDTCSSYLNLFSMRIYVVNNDSIALYAECIECGSICLFESQFRVNMLADTYLIKIDDKHRFTMICESLPDSTNKPTAHPLETISMTFPPTNPTSPSPTPTPQVVGVNVSFGGDGIPIPSTSYLSDPFGRFEATINVVISDHNNILGDNVAECVSCFVWQYRADDDNQWIDINHKENDDISITISQELNEYTTKLILQSIRRLNAGYCVDDKAKANHPFQPDMEYQLRLKFVKDTDAIFISETSNVLYFETNDLPVGGKCIIQNECNLFPLEPYNLFCDFWETENGTALEYNALIGDVVMSSAGFVDDARAITGIAPSGNASITVLIKEQNEYNAITCFRINTTFKTIGEVLSESSENLTSTELVSNILEIIDNITATSSFTESPDEAVSICCVVGELYESNLTNQTESKQIMHDVIQNILETSTVVSPSNASSNITGDAIITELATVTTVTSNVEIVDGEFTTKKLVEEYLPDVFEAVNLYIDIFENDNSSNGSSAKIQNALYSIGKKNQEFISNLEATMFDSITNQTAINVTDGDIAAVNLLSESLVDFHTLAASNALALSDIGETFNYEKTEYDDNGTVIAYKLVNAIKFGVDKVSAGKPSCGGKGQSLRIPSNVVDQYRGDLYCTFLAQKTTNFVPQRDQYESRIGISEGIVTATIYDSAPRRRRLTETVKSSQCDPYLITIELVDSMKYDLNMALSESSDFPSCDFWNTNESLWDTEGCFVYGITNDSVICGCTHLTTFSLSATKMTPEMNVITDIEPKELTISNLLRYPVVWASSIFFLIVFLIICAINPRGSAVHQRSIIALEDSIYQSVRDEKLSKDIIGKEIKWYASIPNPQSLGQGMLSQLRTKDDVLSMLKIHFNLYRVYLNNHHLLLFLFQRSAGTNLCVRQRLALFYLYMSLVMVSEAIFYGREQSTPLQDITASFITSLVSTLPTFVIKKLFIKRKPRKTKSTKAGSIDCASRRKPVIRSKDGIRKLVLEFDVESQVAGTDGTEKMELMDSTKPLDTNSASKKKKTSPQKKSGSKKKAASKKRNTATKNKNSSQKQTSSKKKRTSSTESTAAGSTDSGPRMNVVNLSKDNIRRLDKISALRERLFNKKYKLPPICNEIAWCILMVISLMACFIAVCFCSFCVLNMVSWSQVSHQKHFAFQVLYGLLFDLTVKQRQNTRSPHSHLYDADCWNSSLKLRIEDDLSTIVFNEEFMEQIENNKSSYGGSDAASWLLAIGQSTLLSLVLWQPMTIAIITWLKIWMFTWNLELKYPENVPALIRRCCCGFVFMLIIQSDF